jgi:pimeloyl-ACP methyl ester carboxylesterase
VPGVDPDNLWCVCFSAGGYFGPRAAAHDHRVRGWVFDASLHDLVELPRSVAGVGEMVDGGASRDEVDAHIESLRHLPAIDFSFHWWGRRGGDYTAPVQRYSQILDDMAEFTVTPEMIAAITGPVLLVCGTAEPPSWQRLTREMFDLLTVPDKQLVELGPETGADAHTSVSALPVAESVILPWLHRHAGPGARPVSGPGRP